MAEQGILEQPRLVIAHDVRHFSKKFCQLAARAWSGQGGYSMIFDGPRSTPQLSFAVRHQYAHAGIVITASHNPSHDNGFKAYFSDGAQLIPPHAEKVVEKYKSISIAELLPFLGQNPTDEDPWTVLQAGDEIHITARARSFLYRQIRNITGSLVQVGIGKWDVAAFTRIRDAKDRTKAGPTAPPQGLYLTHIDYELY